MDIALLCSWEVCAFFGLALVWWISSTFLRIKDVAKRHVFITGCDTGFGRNLAESLDRQGITVFAGCLMQSSVEELKRTCSPKIRPICVDVTNSKNVREAADFVKKELDGKALWAIVNNAGIQGVVCPFEFSTKEDCQKVLDVNLLGVYDVTLAFLPLIRKGREGRIVNIASIFGRVSFITGGYPLSKYAVEAFSDGLSREISCFNITVHTLEPGFFKTNVADGDIACASFRKRWNELDPKLREEYGGEEYVEQTKNYTMNFLDLICSPRLDKVVAAYEHALFAKYPKNRYVVGHDARFFFVPLSWLPYRFQSAILTLLEKLRPSMKRPAPKIAVR